MYNILIKDLYTNNNFHNSWPYDQYYISKYIFENKEKFTIFIPDILNNSTPRKNSEGVTTGRNTVPTSDVIRGVAATAQLSNFTKTFYPKTRGWFMRTFGKMFISKDQALANDSGRTHTVNLYK